MNRKHVTRREALQQGGLTLCAMGVGSLTGRGEELENRPADQPFSLPKLPYGYDALAPSIDERTMRIHHDKHHQAYVDGLNAAVAGNKDLQGQSLDELLRGAAKLPEAVRQKIINFGGGHANHSLFWEVMGPARDSKPTGELALSINTAFGSLADFQKELRKAALDRFGSGWAWLIWTGNGLKILSTGNQDSPLMNGQVPLLGLDVWEHAYYLSYQNQRAAYIDAWWKVVNWDNVAQRFASARRT